jgi:hypothetical protein
MATNRTRRPARRQLSKWGVRQPFFVRFHWLIPLAVVIVAVIIGVGVGIKLYLADDARNPSAFSVVAAPLAAAAVVLAYQQWRMSRHEVTFDRYFDRLNVVNQRLAEWPEARLLMSDETGSGSLIHPTAWREKMYVFYELDSLEYIIEKYRLGLTHPELAMRAVQTFRQRCRWRKFRRLVNETLQGRLDYSATTVALVRRMSAAHEYAPGHQSEFERAFTASVLEQDRSGKNDNP